MDEQDQQGGAEPAAGELLPSDHVQAASEAAATRVRRTVRNVAKPAAQEETDPYDTLPSDRREISGEVDLGERYRLNQTESFYRGSIAGATRLQAMAHFVNTPDDKDTPPEVKKARQGMRDEYNRVVADLAHYDTLRPWGTTFEAASALGGQFSGGLASPESWIGAAAKGSSFLWRTLKAGLQQGAIQAGTDPVVQGLNINSGVQKEYDPLRTVISAGMGVIVGGGLHIGGELLSNGTVRKLQAELANEDVSFKSSVSEPVQGPPVEAPGAGVRVHPDGRLEPIPEAAGAREAAAIPAKEQFGSADPSAEAHQAWARDFVDWSARAAFGPDTVSSTAVRARMHELNPEVQAAARHLDDVKAKVNEYEMSQEYRQTPPELQAEFDSAKKNLRAVEGAARKAIKSISETMSLDVEKQALLRPDSDELALRPEGDEQAAITKRQKGVGKLRDEQERPKQGTPSTQVATSGGAGSGLAGPPQTPGAGGAASAPAPSPRDTAIMSLQQQVTSLAEALDIPVRQGRVQIKNALATFNTRSGVVHTREIADFEAVSHEAGHAIEAKAGQELTNLTNAHAAELAPLVSNAAAYDPALHVKEGFAEFIRRYIGNPAHAAQVAPGFTTAFRDFMGTNHPQMLKALDDASAAYRAYLDAPSTDAIHSVIRTKDEDPEGFRGVVQSIHEDGLPAVTRSVFMRAYEALFDQYAPTARAVRDMARAIAEQTGAPVDLKGADNPEVLIRLWGRSKQAAIGDMMDGVYGYHQTTAQGPSLSGALEKATGGMNSGGWGKWDPLRKSLFSDYLVVRRSLVLWDKFDRGDLPNPPVAFSRGDAQRALAEIEASMPTFREASDMVHDWTRQLLKKQFDGGLITRDVYDKLANEPFYVPFYRDMSDKPLAGGDVASSGARDRVAETVKRMRGSSRDIKDPMESLMAQAFLVNRAIQHSDLLRSLVKLSERAGIAGGKFAEKLPATEAKKYTFDIGEAMEKKLLAAGMDPAEVRTFIGTLSDITGEDPIMASFFKMEPTQKRGEPIVFYKEGGETQVARLMSESEGYALYENVTALPNKLTDVWTELVAGSTSVLRSGIVTNPTFAVSNYIRDQFATAILRSDYIPIISGFRGIKAEVTQGEASKLYGLAGGVAAGSSIAPVERAIEANVHALAQKGYIVTKLGPAFNFVTEAPGKLGSLFTGKTPVSSASFGDALKGVADLVSVTEAGTRNSVFEKVYTAKRAQGLSEYEAMIEGAYQATDLLDFSRHGSKTEVIRQFVPFLNAHIQGLDKARRTMVDPIIRHLTGDEVFTRDSEAFRNALLSWTKALGLGSVLGAAWAALNADSEAYRDASPQLKGTHVIVPLGNRVILVPKPFELSLGFTMGEYAYQRMAQNDPRAAEQFVEAAWEVLHPPNPMTEIPAIKIPIELATGKSLYTGRDIVPDELKRRLPAEQYTERTSSLAKTLGRAINVSPIKVDYAIGSVFGTWGRDVATLSSGVDEKAPAQNWEDYVFFRRFIKDPGRTSDVTTKYWGFMAQTTGKFNQDVATYDSMIKGFRDDDARTFLDRLPASERAFVTMKSAAREDGKASFTADEKRLHPLQRAYDAVTLLNGLRREMNANSFRFYETGRALNLTPTERRDLMDGIRELAQIEMRNAFVMMKEPGYANRALIPPQTAMDKIKAVSPEVAEEVATRYATAKVYTTEATAAAYPRLQQSLVRQGSDADLGNLAFDASSEGYEFGGARVKKPAKRRIGIEGAAAH